MRSASMRKASVLIVALALLNFLVFIVVALYIGGDAMNGKIANGHFYLGSHGRYTEVSASMFTYSKWHTYSVWLTHCLAFIAAYFLSRDAKRGPNV